MSQPEHHRQGKVSIPVPASSPAPAPTPASAPAPAPASAPRHLKKLMTQHLKIKLTHLRNMVYRNASIIMEIMNNVDPLEACE